MWQKPTKKSKAYGKNVGSGKKPTKKINLTGKT
jgi:hypothetical protein